jgi:hypothetical protein
MAVTRFHLHLDRVNSKKIRRRPLQLGSIDFFSGKRTRIAGRQDDSTPALLVDDVAFDPPNRPRKSQQSYVRHLRPLACSSHKVAALDSDSLHFVQH